MGRCGPKNATWQSVNSTTTPTRSCFYWVPSAVVRVSTLLPQTRSSSTTVTLILRTTCRPWQEHIASDNTGSKCILHTRARPLHARRSDDSWRHVLPNAIWANPTPPLCWLVLCLSISWLPRQGTLLPLCCLSTFIYLQQWCVIFINSLGDSTDWDFFNNNNNNN